MKCHSSAPGCSPTRKVQETERSRLFSLVLGHLPILVIFDSLGRGKHKQVSCLRCGAGVGSKLVGTLNALPTPARWGTVPSAHARPNKAI